MIPHTLVLKPGLVVHSVYNGYWFWGRPSVDDLWRDLRAATSEIRPDWDLSTPGLREAWDAGDRLAVPRLGPAGRSRPSSRLMPYRRPPTRVAVRVYAAQRKPVASGRGASGLAGRPPGGSSSL